MRNFQFGELKKSKGEEEIYAMKEKISISKILVSTSFVFGILSLFSFVLHFYSANHAPYRKPLLPYDIVIMRKAE